MNSPITNVSEKYTFLVGLKFLMANYVAKQDFLPFLSVTGQEMLHLMHEAGLRAMIFLLFSNSSAIPAPKSIKSTKINQNHANLYYKHQNYPVQSSSRTSKTIFFNVKLQGQI